MAKLKAFPFGKVLISLSAVGTMIGSYVADWNETHIHNPAWPPHAKFHNAQTMSMGTALGLAALYHLWKPGRSRESLDSAAVIASLYGLTQLSAALYPGTASVDPPREDNWPQLKYTLPSLGLILLGYSLDRYRISRA
ncbi:hypothetical protein Amsp01_002290 [Amycolatopsis sp. NBRC 101858]|uniref:DUF6640 family protein n=1 Tax=Amycolatopsis sp. NBRC 101858 TaxID=3032200 RepID=UPI0024A5613D|nr:DUF6640 family protein [Amycolatopsis sp. NBRC 101858]GLY34205.1 hypothetical protein Amsp01_002290 [Amycolatopsis sp. NBRC 101858]